MNRWHILLSECSFTTEPCPDKDEELSDALSLQPDPGEPSSVEPNLERMVPPRGMHPLLQPSPICQCSTPYKNQRLRRKFRPHNENTPRSVACSCDGPRYDSTDQITNVRKCSSKIMCITSVAFRNAAPMTTTGSCVSLQLFDKEWQSGRVPPVHLHETPTREE